jgi:carboxypeptidase Taq
MKMVHVAIYKSILTSLLIVVTGNGSGSTAAFIGGSSGGASIRTVVENSCMPLRHRDIHWLSRCFRTRGGSISSNGSSSKKVYLSTTTTTSNTAGTDDTTTATTTISGRSDPTTSSAYSALLNQYEQIVHLKRAQAVLEYDQLVFMPSKASVARGSQLAALATIIHEKSIHPSLQQYIDGAEKELLNEQYDDTDDDDYQAMIKERKIVVQLAREEYDKLVRIPTTLQTKRAMLSSTAYTAWTQARSTNDFISFAPILQECFDVARETARACMVSTTTTTATSNSNDTLSSSTNTSLYTILMDEYERGMSVERIDFIFHEIQTALVPLLQTVLASPTYQNQRQTSDNDLLHGPSGTYPIAQQQALSQQIVTALGYDLSRGRIDVSVHPFSQALCPTDVRMTSRFQDSEWYQGLAGSIHEAGHAMYEQNMFPYHHDNGTDTDHHSTSSTSVYSTIVISPANNYLSMGCHESQSLFWERHVSLSKSFWKWASPLVGQAFGRTTMCHWKELYQAVNTIQPGCIRVTADELTYPLHVILRYQIERDVIEGTLSISDIPTRWSIGMKQLLNVTVPTDQEGCLQDVHWSSLAIGYFPTYLIGSATAAQLAYYCQRDIPKFDEYIAGGNFVPIREWLTEKVHRHGRRYASLDALLLDQFGEPLQPKYFIRYLTEKYTELYLTK